MDWLLMLRLLPTIMLVFFAGLLCFRGKEGWGWFLFIAFCIAPRAA